MERYRMYYAAGVYWLLDLEQTPDRYKKPLATNEIGSKIWRLMEQGLSTEDISRKIAMEYEADEEVIRDDVNEFTAKLMQWQSNG